MTEHEQIEPKTDTYYDYDDLIDELEAMVRAAEGDGRDAGRARANLAKLKRGMGQPRGADIAATSVIESLIPEDTPEYVADVCYIVGTLLAFHRDSHEDRRTHNNMGAHFREMCEVGEPPPGNVKHRFEDLLNSRPDDLPESLRQAISLLKSKEVSVNWRQLCRDVQRWLNRRPDGDEWRRQVVLSWGKAFWRLPTKPQTNNPILATPRP